MGQLEWTRFTMVVYVLVSQSCQMVCDHGVCDPMGCSPPWNSPGKNTWVGSHFLLQGIFWTQESNLGLSHCRQILYHLSHLGSPQFSSVTQLCPTICDPMDCSTTGFPVHHQLLELTQAHALQTPNCDSLLILNKPIFFFSLGEISGRLFVFGQQFCFPLLSYCMTSCPCNASASHCFL